MSLDDLTFGQKLKYVLYGTILGNIHVKTQIDRFGYDATQIMCTSSRVVNALIGVYSVVALGARMFFNTELDSSPHNLLNIATGYVVIDSLVREGICALGTTNLGEHTPYWTPVGSITGSFLIRPKQQ